LTSVTPDPNGNLLASDFRGNEIYVLARQDDLVAGLAVRVLRVVAEEFPKVTVEVSVETLHREAVVGLKASNFLITEDKRVAAKQELRGAASNNTEADLTIIVDRTRAAAARGADVDYAVREIAAAFARTGAGTLRIVAAGAMPATEFAGPAAQAAAFTAERLQTQAAGSVKTDLAVRLAGNDLVNAQQKRAIIFLTAGGMSADAFDRYGLTDLSSYLNNNHIAFYTVNLTEAPLGDEVLFLTEQTRGAGYYVYRPEGLAPVVEDILGQPAGVYLFSYMSSLPTDFGRALLPVEVECYHLNQSGRGESAYFAPLE
jgi:DNA-binding beta-propeller fold protein YncE